MTNEESRIENDRLIKEWGEKLEREGSAIAGPPPGGFGETVGELTPIELFESVMTLVTHGVAFAVGFIIAMLYF